MSEQKFHSYFGIHSVTAVWLWAFLVPRWPHHVMLLLPPHLLWTLWFLRKYPTEDHLLEVMRTSGLVRQVVWSYVTLIAPLLPFVSVGVRNLVLTVSSATTRAKIRVE